MSEYGESGSRLLSEILSLEREIAKIQSSQLTRIAAFAEVRGGADDVAAELALTLSIGERAARAKLELAVELTSRLPNTLAAMERGEIDAYKASRVAEPTLRLSDEKARVVDTMVAGTLIGKDPSRIRRAVTRAVHRADPGGAAERARMRREGRRVELRHGDDGMATLLADLPAEVASAAYARIDRKARQLRGGGETRSTDQLRADVLADLLLGTPSGAAPAKAEVFVHVGLATLTRLGEQPGELAGHGPIPAPVAREIAFDPRSTWRRIVTDQLTGAPIDAGRERYRPPAVTDDFVRVRDRECRFPGCHRPSRFGDLDHHRDWRRHRGHTNHSNLVGLCRRHHRLKDVPGWVYRLHPTTHRLDVRTPAGRMYRSHAEPLGGSVPHRHPGVGTDGPPPF